MNRHAALARLARSGVRMDGQLVADIGSRLARDGAIYGFAIELYITSEPDGIAPSETLWVNIDGTSTSGFGHNVSGREGRAAEQADIAEWVQDNVFDDMRISSWPECPTHTGEPMIAWSFDGDPEPYWVCRSSAVRIPIGSHPGAAKR